MELKGYYNERTLDELLRRGGFPRKPSATKGKEPFHGT